MNQTRVQLLGACGLLLALAGPLRAYENVGAHPAINECALKVWLQPIVEGRAKGPDKLLNDYVIRDLAELRKLTGLSVTKPGRWHYDIVEGDKQQSFFEWVSNGGYTADEPEWFMSLRHFYDPTRPEGQRYLTDINTMAEWFVWMQKEHPWSGGRDDIRLEDPTMDARHWALRGTNTSRASLPDNPFSWDRGVENMQAAFIETDPKKKDLLFARAWRSLGETMHLLADMTLPAHVRDDGHPLAPYAGPLRTDAYEDAIRRAEVEAVFKQIARDPYTGSLDLPTDIDRQLMGGINATKSPDELFHMVAAYTNTNFFSVDTVFGTDPASGKLLKPVTGREYPSPKLEECTYELGTYIKMIGGFGRSGQGTRRVLMLREGAEKPGLIDYLRRVWHDRPQATLDSTYDCCMTQARVLLPLAIAGNAKLADWFIPRVRVEITNVDFANKTLAGVLTHEPYGAYTRGFHFSCGEECLTLFVNGRSQSRAAYELAIDRGAIRGKLTGLTLQQTDKVSLVVDVGGIPVRSTDTVAGGAWVLVDKVIHGTIEPKQLRNTSGNLTESHSLAFTAYDGRASSKYTYTGQRPEAEKRGSSLEGPYVLPKYLEQTKARQATWTVPPQLLPEGDKLTVSLSLSTAGSGVKCDPPGARGSSTDGLTTGGKLRCSIGLQPSKEQLSQQFPPNPRSLANFEVTTTQPKKAVVLQTPGPDPKLPRLVFSVAFEPGNASLSQHRIHAVSYEYEFRPAGGK